MFGSQPPWGEGAREGWELQPPDRREGGLQLAPLMGGAEGGIFPLLDMCPRITGAKGVNVR